MKTILIAGGAGFVGSNLAKRLLKEGNKVIIIDNLSTGRSSNIEWLKSENKDLYIDQLWYRTFDITDSYFDIMVCSEFSIRPLFKNFVIDEIYHLASPASPPRYLKLPLETFKANVHGTINLLELAKRFNSKILFASTSEIYGDPLVHPQTEDYRGNVNTIGPRSIYDESKRAGETLLYQYSQTHGIKAYIARIFNTSGPRMDPLDGRVVSNFITQLIQDRPVTIYGTGSQTRSFMYVDDLVDGLIKLMNSDLICQPVNLGNPVEFQIIEFAELLISYLNKKDAKIIYENLPQDDPKQRKPDITLAKTKLNWDVQYKYPESWLHSTVEYFTKELEKKS